MNSEWRLDAKDSVDSDRTGELYLVKLGKDW